MPSNGAQHIDPFIDTELSMQADQIAAPALDAQPVDKPNPSLVRAQSGATSLFPVSKADPILETLRPTAQSLIYAHRPLGFLLQQAIIAFSPLASLLGIEVARPASPANSGGNDALE